MNSNLLNHQRKNRTVRSALWAAYGDSLGFITELGNASTVAHRTGLSHPISTTVPWRRQVGGRFGSIVEFPAGTYSDDTQLRLATCRSIQSDGSFDVESFAKIELPVWLGYALGAGLGSKSAAINLAKSSVTWYSNFFKNGKTHYVNGGGNGAAMRIQPHVWTAPNLEDKENYLSNVVKNSIITHGHVRGIAGAMIHAESLAFIFRENRLPNPDEWIDFEEIIQLLPDIINSDGDLKTFWLPAWEQESKISIYEATAKVSEEWHQDCVTASINPIDNSQDYRKIAHRLGALDPEIRGSGTKAAIFALCASWAHRNETPELALESIANFLESDTDTIATMTGALIGAISDTEPQAKIQDREYISATADRLYQISQKNTLISAFNYPDSLYWQPPKTALDVVGMKNEKITIAGLGDAQSISGEFPTRQGDTVYQWCRLSFDQTVLVKKRKKLRDIKADPKINNNHQNSKLALKSKPNDLFSNDTELSANSPNNNIEQPAQSLDEITNIVIKSNFDPETVGIHLLKLAQGPNGINDSIAFAAIISKAQIARKKRQDNNN